MSGQILDPYDVPLSAINKSNVSISISIIRNVTLLLWFCSEKAYTGSTYNGSINTMNKILHIQNTGASVNVYTRTGGELLSQWLVGARVAALSTSGNFTRTFSAIHTGQWKKKTNAPVGVCIVEREVRWVLLLWASYKPKPFSTRGRRATSAEDHGSREHTSEATDVPAQSRHHQFESIHRPALRVRVTVVQAMSLVV